MFGSVEAAPRPRGRGRRRHPQLRPDSGSVPVWWLEWQRAAAPDPSGDGDRLGEGLSGGDDPVDQSDSEGLGSGQSFSGERVDAAGGQPGKEWPRTAAPSPGANPTRTRGSLRWASSARTTMSHKRATSIPHPPRARSATIAGTGRSRIAWYSDRLRSNTRRRTSASARMRSTSERSPPPLEHVPAPVSTTVLTSGSTEACWTASKRACWSSSFTALRRSGRFSVSVHIGDPTPSTTTGCSSGRLTVASLAATVRLVYQFQDHRKVILYRSKNLSSTDRQGTVRQPTPCSSRGVPPPNPEASEGSYRKRAR